MEYVSAKTIVTKNKNSDYWFGCHYNMNIYRGCNHGCIYCDSRSDCYHIENFDDVRAKKDALIIIERELKSKRKTGVIGTGAMSDPYNSYEKKNKLTRGALELINSYKFGVNIITKSNLITRDIDVLKDINNHSPVCIGMTITSASDILSKKIEPVAPSSTKRFEAIESLSLNDIYTGIIMMPILPFISDSDENIISIVKKAADSGTRYIYPWFGMTLRNGQREYYYNSINKLYPGLKEKYETTFKYSYQCNSIRNKRLWEIFCNECIKNNIRYKMKDIIDDYKREVKEKQISMF